MAVVVASKRKAIMRTFGKCLKKARERSGYRSAQAFAAVIDLEPHTYRKYERGQAQPPFKVIARICDELHITPNDLLRPRSVQDTGNSSNPT
jgi:transcriptional regulator with XRE-family HTH domain